MHSHSHMPTHSDIFSHTLTYSHTLTQLHLHTYTFTHIHTCITHIFSHTLAHSHTLLHPCTHTLTYSHNALIHSHAHTYTHSHIFSHTLSDTHTCIHIYSLTHTYSHTLPYINTLTYSHTHTHTSTHLHVFSPCFLTLSHPHTLTYSHTLPLTHTHLFLHTLTLRHTHKHTHTMNLFFPIIAFQRFAPEQSLFHAKTPLLPLFSPLKRGLSCPTLFQPLVYASSKSFSWYGNLWPVPIWARPPCWGLLTPNNTVGLEFSSVHLTAGSRRAWTRTEILKHTNQQEWELVFVPADLSSISEIPVNMFPSGEDNSNCNNSAGDPADAWSKYILSRQKGNDSQIPIVHPRQME